MSVGEAAFRRAPVRLLVAIVVVAVLGCSNSVQTATLTTNLPQLISYTDRFNATSDLFKITVRYAATPADFELEIDGNSDLIAGTSLRSVTAIDRFADVSAVLEALDRSSFYPGLLRLGEHDGKQLLLPLSFNIPMMIFSSTVSDKIASGVTLEIDELRKLTVKFESDPHGDGTRMAFSARWDGAVAYLFTRFFDVDFRETDQALPAWNDVRLQEAVDYIRAWSREINGGSEREDAFQSTYLYDPGYKLVSDERIRFSHMGLDDYLHVPGEIRERLDFRWLSHDGSIPVDEDIVFVGRLRSAKNRRAADAFLVWILDPRVQAELLEIDRYRRVRGFGFAGGFSGIKSTNTGALSRLFPEVRGRAPLATSLRFPSRIPVDWPLIRTMVVYPWLLEESAAERSGDSLSEHILQWRRGRPAIDPSRR